MTISKLGSQSYTLALEWRNGDLASSEVQRHLTVIDAAVLVYIVTEKKIT